MLNLHRLDRDPCASCDHPRGDHHHYPGANFNPGHWGECEAGGCLCRLFVRDCTPEEAERAA